MAPATHPAGALLGALSGPQQDDNREHEKGRKNCGHGGDGHDSGLGVDDAGAGDHQASDAGGDDALSREACGLGGGVAAERSVDRVAGAEGRGANDDTHKAGEAGNRADGGGHDAASIEGAGDSEGHGAMGKG